MKTFLIDMTVYVLMVAGVALVMVSIGYAMDLGPIEDPYDFNGLRDRTSLFHRHDDPPVVIRPQVQTWMDSGGGLTYLFNYGRTTMTVPQEQLLNPNTSPTFDPFGVVGRGSRDETPMLKRRDKR